MASASIIQPIKLEQGSCNCSHQYYQLCILIYISVLSKNKWVQVFPQILQSVQEMLLEIWKSTVFYQVNMITRLFMLLSLTWEHSIYYVVYSKLVKISSDTQFLKFYTVLYRWSKRTWWVLALFCQQKLEQGGCNCSHQKYLFCIFISYLCAK